MRPNDAENDGSDYSDDIIDNYHPIMTNVPPG